MKIANFILHYLDLKNIDEVCTLQNLKKDFLMGLIESKTVAYEYKDGIYYVSYSEIEHFVHTYNLFCNSVPSLMTATL